MQPVEYYVFDSTSNLWLQDDEQSWGPFYGAAAFNNATEADEVMESQMQGAIANNVGYVLALMS